MSDRFDPLNPGVPLGRYREVAFGVELRCVGCALVRDFPLEAVITRLDARGFKGAEIGVRAVAGLTTEPCPRCAGVKFESRPAFADMPGQAKRH